MYRLQLFPVIFEGPLEKFEKLTKLAFEFYFAYCEEDKSCNFALKKKCFLKICKLRFNLYTQKTFRIY